MNLNTALDKLFSKKQMGVKLGLENIQKLLTHIGNPEKKLKAFHIAGSNGKGSTSSFLASMLMESGYKTGLYTSPHLVKFNERIRINGFEITDEYIADFINSIDGYIDKEEPTFFEITTAMAFKYFADHELDYCVIETGLGGRLDATNTLNPLASIITTISLEHTRILGDTLSQIAGEKAGIIKASTPVFLGKMPSEAKHKIEEIAREKDSRIFDIEKYSSSKGNNFAMQNDSINLNLYKLPLIGKYQFYNAGLAALTISEILQVDSESILRGIKNVLLNSGLKGRFEIFNENPAVIFDSAHNEEGIEAFLEAFTLKYYKIKHKEIIFGAMADKNLEIITKMLAGKFDKYFVTTIDFERAATTEELEKHFNKHGISPEVLINPAEYISKFVKDKKDSSLVVLGSIYVLGNIKEKLAI